MYYTSTAQQQQQQARHAAAFQNMPDNMAGPGGAAPWAACEAPPQGAAVYAGQQPAPQPPAGGSTQYAATPPLLNLAKVSRNHEAQTTPRRAQDAAYASSQQAQAQAHLHHLQEQQLAEQQHHGQQPRRYAVPQQHQQPALKAAGPRIVNIDATAEGAGLSAPLPPRYAPPAGGFGAAAVPGMPGQPAGAALPASQYQQYQQQARYAVPPQGSRPSPRAGGAAAGQQQQQQGVPATARGGALTQCLPQFFPGSATSREQPQAQPQAQPQGAHSARGPASARQAPLNPYLQALPAATARPHHSNAAAAPAAPSAPPPAAPASSTLNLPPLPLAPGSARRPAGAAGLQTSRAAPASQGQAPAPASARGGGKDDVYARLSQGLPSVETARSARLQAARPAQPQQQAQQQASQPPRSGAPAQRGTYSAAVAPQGQQAWAMRLATGLAGQQAQGSSSPNSTGLTPRAARLAVASPGSPFNSSTQHHQQQQPSPLGHKGQQAPPAAMASQHQQGDNGHLLASYGGPGPPVQQPLGQVYPASGPAALPQPLESQPYQALPPQQLYSSGALSSYQQVDKAQPDGPFDAQAASAGGHSAHKFAALQPQGWPDADAIRAVHGQQQQQQQYGAPPPQLPPQYAAMPPSQPRQQPAPHSLHSSFERFSVTPPQQPFAGGSGYLPAPHVQLLPPQPAAGQPLLPGLPFIQQQPLPQALPHMPAPGEQQAATPFPQYHPQLAPLGGPAAAAHLPVSMSDLDLMAAVAEEVSVYDLQRQQQLEQQAAAAAAAAARRASQAAAQAEACASVAGAAAAPAAPPARRLSYHPPGSAAPAEAAPRTGSRPATASTPSPTPSRQQAHVQERRPVTAASALRQWSHLLTGYEQSEILAFQQVWFVGKPGAAKIKGDKASGEPNAGYDDARGDYITVTGDHIAYRYEVTGVLGRGSFGQVLRAFDHRRGQEVALKVVRNKKRFQKQAAVEAAILALLREQDPDDSVNIVRTYESFTFRGHLCITFELLSINLYEYIKACNFTGSSLAVVRRVAAQVLVTLRFLLSINVVHCDLKPENILLRERGKTAIKVIDFGSSCYVDKRLYTYIQSRFYRSPEVILGLPYGPPIDMWSLGCILAELLTGQPIFPGEDEKEQLGCIMELLGPPPRALLQAAPRANIFFDTGTWAPLPCPPNSRGKTRRPSSCTMERALGGCDDAAFIDFLQLCLQWVPEERMTPEQALQHRWIAGMSSGGDTRRHMQGGSSGLAALASGLLSGTARVAAQAGLL